MTVPEAADGDTVAVRGRLAPETTELADAARLVLVAVAPVEVEVTIEPEEPHPTVPAIVASMAAAAILRRNSIVIVWSLMDWSLYESTLGWWLQEQERVTARREAEDRIGNGRTYACVSAESHCCFS